MKRKTLLSVLLALGLAGAAAAQTGKSLQYSNAPTDTDYRLTIIEPKAGATIVGKDVNVVVSLPTIPPGNKPQSQGSDLKQKDMNTPIFQIWVDGKNYGNLPGGQNVFYAQNLSYGPHKISVMAKNASGEVVDRKEISITTVEKAGSVAMTQSAAPAPPPEPAPAPPAPRAEVYSPPPAAAPAAPIETTLPHTATSYPLAAAAGVLLLVAGLVLRRKS
jgi:LPXTG-motif cell wall-anchored protein